MYCSQNKDSSKQQRSEDKLRKAPSNRGLKTFNKELEDLKAKMFKE